MQTNIATRGYLDPDRRVGTALPDTMTPGYAGVKVRVHALRIGAQSVGFG